MTGLLKLCSFLLLMHGECRGEQPAGQLKVAQVVFERNMNILDPKQFNCFDKSTIKLFETKNTLKILEKINDKLTFNQIAFYTHIYIMKDLLYLTSDGSNYYMTKKAWSVVKYRYPKWAKTLTKTKTEGNHIFFKGEKI